jgi:hypothetical protein
MIEWLEFVGGILVAGFLLSLLLFTWVVYPLWSAFSGFRDLRMRSWAFSLRSLLAVVAASAFVTWFIGWQTDRLTSIQWREPNTWLFIAAPVLVLLAYLALVWMLVSDAIERRHRTLSDLQLRPDDIEIREPDGTVTSQAIPKQAHARRRKKRRWWRRRLFGGYPALRSGRMPESPPHDDE